MGNPPWEEATLEEDEFWKRYAPGLMGHTQTEQERIQDELRNERPDLVRQYEAELEEQEKRREILRNGPYPGMGTGDPDTYKAFYWRFWHLIGRGGFVGVVLPRSALVAAGSEKFRRKLLGEGEITDLTLLKNKRGWVFDSVTEQYTVALLDFKKETPDENTMFPLRGPFPDPKSYEAGIESGPYLFPVESARNWTKTASFPMLPANPTSVPIFKQLFEHPPLGLNNNETWRARPNTELHATNDKKMDDGTPVMHFIDEPLDDYWPVFKGASFTHWNPDTSERYAWADPDTVLSYLQKQRENSYQYAGKRSAFYEMPEEWVHDDEELPCFSPRLVFRDMARSSDPRTVITALAPPNVVLTNTAPYFLWPRGDEKDEAYLLGVLASIPLDWYARRFVETHLNYHIINAFPIPRPGDDSPLRNRVIQLAGRLAAVDERYAEWAEAVGVEYGPLDEAEQLERIYELDAVVAHLYGLSREHLRVVFETFHEGWDYEERLTHVLEYYDEWADRLDREATAQ